MNIRNIIQQVLSDKKARHTGLHVNHITKHILIMNSSLFPDNDLPDYNSLKVKINRILLYDVHHSKSPQFIRVYNPKTKTYKKGVYKLNQ